MKRILPLLLLLPVFANASLVADGGTETLLDDGAEAVHAFTQSGTFTLFADSTVRLLVVGGGGGGGGDCSGGGGGGGVIETNDLELSAGRYTVTVGGGGLMGTATGAKGENGGDSVVVRVASDGTETELFRAYGGGGGGAWNNGAGRDGGCGGGPTANGNPGQGVAGQGYPSVKGSGNGPQGGGGAGGSPLPGTIGAGSGDQRQPSGGPGRTNDITGTLEVYGPGGGAGGYNVLGGFGGDTAPDADGWTWGNGWSHNSKESESAMDTAKKARNGRDGHGGGGGGGSNSHYAGGQGGSGAVIFRLSNELTSPDPTIAVSSVSPSCFGVTFPVSVSYAGAGYSEVELSLQFSSDAADFGAGGSFAGTETVLDAHFFGTGTFTVSDLKPAHGYFFRVVARNAGGGETASSVFSFTTPAQNEAQWVLSSGRVVEDGLLQLYYKTSERNGANYSFDETEPGLAVMPGTIAAALSTFSNSSGLYSMLYVAADGTQWTLSSGWTYAYRGYMWMEAGSAYNFFANWMDNTHVSIDGVRIMNASWNANPISRATYTCTETGWHLVQIWFCQWSGNGGNQNNWTFAFGWNQDGETAPSGRPGLENWSMLDLASGARLKTGRPGREVSVAGYVPDGNALDFSVALAAGDSATLYAVWDSAYPAAPEDTNAWANAVAVGPADGTAQTLSATVPATAKYARFYAVQDADGTVCWSPTAQIDLSSVSISGLGVVADGDTGTFSVRVGSVGTGTFSLALELADNAAMTGARTIAIDAAAPGDYAVTTNVAPGATTWYRFVATTTDGGSDQTAVASFTTLAGTVINENPTVTVNNRTITLTMPDLAFGAGVQTWKVLYGTSADESTWEEDTAIAVIPRVEGGYSLFFARPELPQTWYFRLVSENVAPGGTSWTSRTSVLSAETKDAVTYTWKKDVAEGSWTNAACWSFSSSDRLCTGYPSNSNCSVYFQDKTTATIYLPAGTYPTGTYHLNADGSHIVLVGEGRSVTVLSGDGYAGTMRGETFEVRSMTVMERDRFDDVIGNYGSGRESTNAVFRVADGGYVRMGGSNQGVRGTNSAFRVEGGSELYMGELNPIRLNGAGETILVDDSLLTMHTVELDYYSSLGPQTARFAGKGAKLVVTSGLFSDATGRAAVHDFTLLFEPDDGGYTNGPVVFCSKTDGDARPLGTMRNAGSTAKFRVVVDPIRMRRAAKAARGFAIGWKKGILEENVILVPGDGYTLRFTYGWDDETNLPLALDAPENEGDLPTGVWFKVPKKGTMILVR